MEIKTDEQGQKWAHDYLTYSDCLEAAGAKVLAYQQFGSYQGQWAAKVEFEGRQGWVIDWYGSCSGCDAIESHFGWHGRFKLEKVADFGAEYLKNLSSQEETEKGLDANYDSEILAYVKANAFT